MAFVLPPRLKTVRHTLAYSHNRRIILVMLVSYTAAYGGLLIAKYYHCSPWLALVGAGFIGIPGAFYALRLSKTQSIALGFICPLCNGALYDGRDNRLGSRGECPCCKQFIIERLNQEVR